jgi:hypothetical protein
MWMMWAIVLFVALKAIWELMKAPSIRSPAWQSVVVLLADATVVGLIIFFHDPEPLSASEAFQKLYTLTPSELQQRCGPPDKSVTGVLVEGDGIQELYYGYHTAYRQAIQVDLTKSWGSH